MLKRYHRNTTTTTNKNHPVCTMYIFCLYNRIEAFWDITLPLIILGNQSWREQETLGKIRPLPLIGLSNHKLSQKECWWTGFFFRGDFFLCCKCFFLFGLFIHTYCFYGTPPRTKIDFLRALPKKWGEGLARIFWPFFPPCCPLYFDINIMLNDTF